ncbi:MAG: glycosyltransferase family 39 protein [Minicystis sp.]
MSNAAPDEPDTEAAPPASEPEAPEPHAAAPSSTAPVRRAAPFDNRVLAVACATGMAFLLLQILLFGYGRDQGIYAMVGRAVVTGGMPYRDAWDFKPPGIFLIYGFTRAVFGSGQWAIRLVEVLGLVATTVAMMRLTDRWWGDRRVGLLAGTIMALVHAQLEFWHTAQPESFGGMLTIFALLPLRLDAPAELGHAAPDRDTLKRWAISGALFGLAGLLKPPLAGGGAVVALMIGVRILRARASVPIVPRLRAALIPAAAVTVGGAAPLVLCALWFLARGAFRDLYQVLFVFTPHYTKLSWVGETLTGMTYWGFTEWLQQYCSVPTVGFLLFLAFPRAAREKAGSALIAGIIGVHIAGVIMQGKFFPYHYGATWPLTALLAAVGFMRVWDWLASRAGPLGVALFFVGFGVVCFFRTATKDTETSFLQRCGQRLSLLADAKRDQLAIDRLASVADVNAAANREVAAFLRARVPADRKVFVWGFEPVIYDLADRAPATRYLYDVPQRVAWAKQNERDTLMRDLDAGRPAAIVVEHRDVFPMVTGDAIDSADTLKDFPALRDRIAERYDRAATIEDFDVYLER